MNPRNFVEAKKLFDASKKLLSSTRGVELVIAPPMPFLQELAKRYKGTRIEFAAQDISEEIEGSHTGDISAYQVKSAGATQVILGHAERRALGESDELVRDKVEVALGARLDVIIAVGEGERDAAGEYIVNVRRQINTALDQVPEGKFKNVTIAYEPIWAIGAPEAPNANEVHQMVLLVRKTVADEYGSKAMKDISIVYGGSVNDENAFEILAVPGLDGVLVGRAGLDPKKLEVIIRAAASA